MRDKDFGQTVARLIERVLNEDYLWADVDGQTQTLKLYQWPSKRGPRKVFEFEFKDNHVRLKSIAKVVREGDTP